jgi:uncharacterized protein (DUF1330 family)
MGTDRGEIPGASKSHKGLLLLKEARNTSRVIIAEFPSYEVAKACYEDPAYQEAGQFALRASKRDLLIFEGEIA